ncbi:MAG: YbaB/EbfC family nucleoid-associated protein [Clostridia bacterium]|nr:YbaB/EbfC family nucleoid-associated protein [Candidatus Pelethousia sp.]NCB32046.1 YbaB/EbfC family nucleoid-associated protein [Clostridia bacterium]
MAKGGFPGMGGMNMQQLMKQAQQMQQNMAKMQEELAEREFTASSGGGAVKATVTGGKLLKAVEIDPGCMDSDDVEMLQDMILAAVNEALRAADQTVSAEMGKLTGGAGLGF